MDRGRTLLIRIAGKLVGRIPGKLVAVVDGLVSTGLGIAFFFLSVLGVGVIVAVIIIELGEL